MERQRSFSFKPSRLLLFSFTIFSSILFLSIFTIWLTKSSPSLHTQTLLHFNTSSSSLQPSLTVHSLSITDVKIPTFIDNRLVKSQKSYSESKSEPLIVNFTAMHHDNGTSPAKRLEASGFVGQNKTQVEILRNMSIEQKIVKKECDLTKGYWVFDESYPLYDKGSCPYIDEGFDCEGNGRLDRNYSKWRWQPNDCDLPRFNATKMLELIRGKRLVFVGDSINRNQWESMLCMLLSAIKDPKRVFEARGRKITKEKGNYSFRFLDYECTVEYYVSHYLVHESKARVGQKRRPTLRIDAIDHGSSRWRGADIVVFNTAHWWSHHKTKAGLALYLSQLLGPETFAHVCVCFL